MRTQSIFRTLALLSLPAALLFTACDPALTGSGAILSETRNTDAFTGVDVSVSGDVSIIRGDTFRVQVRAEENLLPYLQTRTEGNNLHIYFSRNVRDVDGLEVEITMPELKHLQLSGSARLETDGAFSGSTLNLGLSGSGRLILNEMNYPFIAAHVSGSGSILLKGQSDDTSFSVSGSGEVDALQCPTKTAEVHVSGSGTVRLKVSEVLETHISGSGNVWYDGSPSLDTHISGSGQVRKM
ncbi:MAG: DUF2807 domain-containing protein [Lewinellaceae bacterium]|nr:DUF2807 domain-containing protein [Lewinellaceae bacterium]